MAKDVADLLRFLPSIALFGGLGEESLYRIIGMLQEHVCTSGTLMCKQGEVGRSMFLVRRGEAVVYREIEGGGKLKMVRLGEGEFFGEMTLIDVMKRSASVVIEGDALLYSLGNRELYKLYQEDVPGYVMVLQNICRELSRRLRTTNQKLTDMAQDNGSDESTLITAALRPRPKPI